MICPNCQLANPDAARFCMQCGTPLSQTCPNCQTTLPAGARFCFSCGTALQAAATPPPVAPSPPAPAPPAAAPRSLDKLQQFIPQELLRKLDAARADGIEGERRIVTMLFCDVQGSTAAANSLDPEEWAEIINGAFEAMIAPVYRYEGTVARLMGDGLLAFFGAPIAHEDDPERAVLAGLEIAEAMQAYRTAIMRQWGIDCNVRVGINTGLVVVGAVGSDLRMEYTALGDAINMAARMEQTAVPGSVQIAQATYKHIAPLFDVETIERLVVKGRPEPITAYRVLTRKAQRGKLRGLVGLHSPLVGRARETATLNQAAQQLLQGRGQIVSVMGEAGLGKSRLVAELRTQLAANDDTPAVIWLEGRSLSYENSVPYAAFGEMLVHLLGVPRGAPYAQLVERLAHWLPETSARSAAFLADLLDTPLPDGERHRVAFLEPFELRNRIFTTFEQLLTALTTRTPAVLFLDDLHWSDPTSLDLLEALLPLVEQRPLLIITAFRPRRQEPSWQLHETAGRDYYHLYTALALQPLDESEARLLVANLLTIEDLPESLRQEILDKAEGNPFFVEEVIRSLLDAGLIVRDGEHWRATRDIISVKVPDTLVGVINARLDRLDDSARAVVQAAAVLGREFSFEMLRQIVPEPDQLDDDLLVLQRRQIVRELARLPVRRLRFKHVLTCDAAYDSVLLSRRRDLHLRAADLLVAHEPGRAADIGRHYVEARQFVRAIPWLVEAGHRAAKAYAATEAIAFYRQVLTHRTAIDDSALLRQVYEGLGAMLQLSNQVAEAYAVYIDMRDYAVEIGDCTLEVMAFNKLAFVTALMLGRFDEADGLLARATALNAVADTPLGAADTALTRCLISTAKGDFDHVIQNMDALVATGEEIGSMHFQVVGLAHIANSLISMCKYAAAEENARRGLALARQSGARLEECQLLVWSLAHCAIARGDYDEALAHIEDGLQIADHINAAIGSVLGRTLAAEIYSWRGQFEQAMHYGHAALHDVPIIEESAPYYAIAPLGTVGTIYLDISEQYRDEIARLHQHALRMLESPIAMMNAGSACADVGWCALEIGDPELARAVFERGRYHPSVTQLPEQPRILSGLATLAMRRGDLAEAQSLAEEACQFVEKHQMQHYRPLVQLTIGQVALAAGRPDAALIHLRQAADAARALQMRSSLWRICGEQARALAAAGQAEAAGDAWQTAHRLIQVIAADFSDAAMRSAYLRSTLRKLGARP